MRKILLAIDALELNVPSIDFACYIAALTKSKLTGVFLENVLNEEITEEVYASLLDENELSRNQRTAIVDNNIHLFRNICEEKGINACIHRDRGMPASEIIEESRFADLIIVEPDMSFKNKLEGSPSSFVKDILAEAECPVIISPQSFEGVNEIMFSYDGSKSSVFAIKQFTYLFPELSSKKITLVEVNKTKELTLKAKPKIFEWLKNYYSDLHFEILCGEPEEELFKYVFEKRSIMLVMGAYGRNPISSFLKESRAALIVRTTNLPIFITHH